MDNVTQFRGVTLTAEQIRARQAGEGFSFNADQARQLDAAANRERTPDGHRRGAPVVQPVERAKADDTDHGPAAAALRDAQAFAEKHTADDDGEDHIDAALRAARLHG